jgi:hypothetical protein
MGGDINTRKSTTGVLFFYVRHCQLAVPKAEGGVALSSCKAEYNAGTTVACQGKWLA